MKLRIFFIIGILFLGNISCQSLANTQSSNSTSESTPKLMIGIVVDQMRQEYLHRFYNRYSDGGFKRLMNAGFNYENAQYNYIPTYTGPGHSSIFTGTTPATHGIVSNNWFDPIENISKYCVQDDSVRTVGDATEFGKMSPFNQKSTTIGDELKLASAGQSKVVGVALKDRSSILPAGHAADGAYWFSSTGKFISSTWYLNDLPDWVKEFNELELASKYLNQNWETFYPIETYTVSLEDNNNYEKPFTGEKAPVFPHQLWTISKKGKFLETIKATPFGNTLTRQMAEAAIKGEGLGQDEIVDFLSISFSSIDYVGHQFGPNSIEMEDAMIRLDLELEQFFDFLDKNIGKGNYTLFLTADHGANNVPSHMTDLKIPSGYFRGGVKNHLDSLIKIQFNAENIIKDFSNYQVFYNHDEIIKNNIDLESLDKFLTREIFKFEGVNNILNRDQLLRENYTQGYRYLAQNGYHPQLSGDLWIILNPGWMTYGPQGTTHGSPFSYDTHIPLLWYGKNIPHGKSMESVNITDIAPTTSYLIRCPKTNGNIGRVLSFE